jgi:hypothetical protein
MVLSKRPIRSVALAWRNAIEVDTCVPFARGWSGAASDLPTEPDDRGSRGGRGIG